MLPRALSHLFKMTCTTMSSFSTFAKSSKKILGVGINYNAALKANPSLTKPENPIIFLKPSTSLIEEGQNIIIPKGFTVNEEIELGIVIGKTCKNVPENKAMEYVAGYCVALDLTATSELIVARKMGMPWTMGKGFDTACPVSRFISKEEIPDPGNVQLWVKINDKMVQEGNTNDLIFSVPKLISFISKYMTLEANDLIVTGTPPGMSVINPGDKIQGGIKDLITIQFNVE